MAKRPTQAEREALAELGRALNRVQEARATAERERADARNRRIPLPAVAEFLGCDEVDIRRAARAARIKIIRGTVAPGAVPILRQRLSR